MAKQKPVQSSSKFHIDFMRYGFFAVILTAFTLIATVYLLATRGLNFGIDFTGGVVVEIHTSEVVPLEHIRTVLTQDDRLKDAALTNLGNPQDLMIRLGAHDATSQNAAAKVEVIKQLFTQNIPNVQFDYRKVDVVGPQVGGELIHAALLALGLSLLAITVYIWFRFEWQFGICALITPLHDALITIGFYALTQIEFNLTSVAAVLTITGYSVNDTVVVYDRVREIMRKYKKLPMRDVVNTSVNETLSRTILTVSTTLVAVVSLILLGGEVIRGFSLAMAFGIVVGTYSSIYVSSYLLLWFNIRKEDAAPADVATKVAIKKPAIAKK